MGPEKRMSVIVKDCAGQEMRENQDLFGGGKTQRDPSL